MASVSRLAVDDAASAVSCLSISVLKRGSWQLVTVYLMCQCRCVACFVHDNHDYYWPIDCSLNIACPVKCAC